MAYTTYVKCPLCVTDFDLLETQRQFFHKGLSCTRKSLAHINLCLSGTVHGINTK